MTISIKRTDKINNKYNIAIINNNNKNKNKSKNRKNRNEMTI